MPCVHPLRGETPSWDCWATGALAKYEPLNLPGPIPTRGAMGRPKAWHPHSAFARPILAFRNLAGLDFILAAVASSRMLSSRHPGVAIRLYDLVELGLGLGRALNEAPP